MDLMRKILISTLWLVCALLQQVQASESHPLLPEATAVAPSVEFTRFGFSIYRAQLWAPKGRYIPDQPFVLSLTYSRDIARDRLLDASLTHMQKLGAPVQDQPHWRGELENVLTDVKQGDTLSGVYRPGQGAEFFYQEKKLGELNDVLALHFFSIWLDPRTSEPELRLALIGQTK